MGQEDRILVAVGSCFFGGIAFDIHWLCTGVALGLISFCFCLSICINSKGWGK